jgi:hypothetical protein
MNEKVLIGVFVATEGAHAFSAFMPSYLTIGSFVRTPQDLAHLRSGYFPATVFNLALGGVVSALIKSVWPMVLAGAVSGLMITTYEHKIRESRTGGFEISPAWETRALAMLPPANV